MTFENPPPLDIRSFVNTLFFIVLMIGVLVFISRVRSIRASRKINYFKMRRNKLILGWKLLFTSIGLILVSYFINTNLEQAAYQFIPITETPSLTSTISPVPSITLTPTITWTPSITPTLEHSLTPTITSTPHMPIAIEAQFTGLVTPPSEAVFSDLTFAQGIDSLFRPIRPSIVFQNPIGKIFAMFSFDQMVDGVQWTALWYRNSELVFFETKPWEKGTGGLGFSD